MKIKAINSIQIGNDLVLPGEVFEAPAKMTDELVKLGVASESDEEVTLDVKIQGDLPKPTKAKGRGE